MKSLRRSLWVVTATLLLTALGFAQSNSAEFHADGNGGVQTADLRLMGEVAQNNMSKIDLAYLALKNSDNEQVKAFAQQVLIDYGNANRELSDIARAQFLALPDGTDAKQQDTFQALSQLHGAAFDKAYMQAMLKGDKSDMSKLKEEASKGNNQSMIDWASRTLPTIDNNLKEAQKIAPKVGVHATLTSEEQQNLNASKPANAPSQAAH